MDPYLTSVYGTEQSLYDQPIKDKSSLETSVFASSPNSLFMYEQEKADMQSSLGNMACGRNNNVMNDEFDLNSQFETSRDICQSMPKVLTSFRGEESGNQNYDNTWTLDKKSDIDFLNCDIFPMDEDMDNPTLAELNASESLLDDLASIVDSALNENALNKSSWTNSAQKQQIVPETSMQIQQVGSNWPQSTEVTGQILLAKQQGGSSFGGRKPSATVTTDSENTSNTGPRLHQLLQNQTSPVKIEAKSASSPVQSVPNMKFQSSPGKRKQNISNVEVDEKWEEIKHYIYDEDDEEQDTPRPKQTRLSSGRFFNDIQMYIRTFYFLENLFKHFYVQCMLKGQALKL